MQRFSSTKRYTAIQDESSSEQHNMRVRSRKDHHYSSSRESPPPEYELSEQKVSPSSPSPLPDRPERTKGHYSVVSSSTIPRSSLSASIGAGKVDTGFNPLFTRRWVLLCFAALWVAIIASLQVIYSVSASSQGLATTDSSTRYVWTYGPTAFLIVCTVMWRQVDYAVKYIQPWAALAKGPLPAEQTILLDYITEIQLVAFWKAVKSRHATIASTILIFVLIKVLTVISTGLLVLEPVLFDGVAQSMRATTKFDSQAILSIDSIDSRAAIALYGHEEYQMSLPNGTTEQYAFQLFQPSTELSDDVSSYNASVDVFAADGWECETGELTYETGLNRNGVGDFGPEMTGVSSYYNTTIKLPGCDIYNAYLDAPSWFWSENSTDPLYGYWAAFQRVNCSNLDPTDAKYHRYMISAAYSKGVGQNDNTMLNSSNIICRPSYGIHAGYVTRLATGNIGHVVISRDSEQLGNLTADDLILAASTSIKLASVPADVPSYNVTTDSFVAQMIRLSPDFEWDMLLNNTWLTTMSQQVFQQTAAQIAGLYLLQPDDQDATFDGTVTRIEQRLTVRSLPTRLMQACAATMFALTIMMLFTVPQNVVPRPVESLASIAVILARSPSLVDVLRNTGHLDADQLRQALSGFTFMSTVADAPYGKTFSIRAIANSGTQPLLTTTKHIRWTRPLVLRRVVMILTLALAVAVLIALEILYRQAIAHNGLADVDVDSLQRYVWLYTPTIVLILLATTFNVLDFELEFTDPYHELARGYANASSSLLWDPLRNISPQTCFHAFRRSRFALVASSLSVIVAPVLTIVVSGLFVAQSVPHSQSLEVATQSWFNVSSSSDFAISGDASSFAIPSLILQGNMSYPQWTYNEFAFPAIDLSARSMGVANSSSGSLLVDSPAVRGAVNCTLVPESQFYELVYGKDCKDCIYYNISTPDGCGNGGWIWTDNIWRSGSTKIPVSGAGYFGSIAIGAGETTRTSDNQTVFCPNYVATYGRIEGEDIKDYNVFFCTTGFETVQTQAQIDLGLEEGATISSVPTIHENTSRTFNDFWAPSGNAAGPYFVPINLTHTDEMFDNFVTAMAYGKDGIPSKELFSDPEIFQKQFIHTYRQWTAQWANLHLREPIDSLAKNTSNIAGSGGSGGSGGGQALPNTLTAAYTDPTRQRLFLNEVSTRILQGVIAVLILCGIVIFFLVDMSHVLPKKVGSIAAVASMLAGSRFVDNEKSGLIPRGTEWLSDEKIRRSGMWDGEKFRMGWWDGEGGIGGEEGVRSRISRGSDGDHVGEEEDEQAEVEGRGEKERYFRIDAVPRAGV